MTKYTKDMDGFCCMPDKDTDGLTVAQYWSNKLIHDVNPDHFDYSENFVPYMKDEKISSFGQFMFNMGYNSGLWNLQTKIDTRTGWVSVKDRLPKLYGTYTVCMNSDKEQIVFDAIWDNDKQKWMSLSKKWEYNHITHWRYLPELPKEEDNTGYYEMNDDGWSIAEAQLLPVD